MIGFALRRLPRWFNVVMLVMVALFLFPALTFAVSTTDVTQMFKYTYGTDRLLYLAAQEIVLWRILKRKQKPMGGRGQWILPIQKQNAGVFVGHQEGGAKTTRRAQPAAMEALFSLQEFHGVWDISWKMLQDARKDEYAFARAIDFVDESFKRRVYRLLNADMLGTGVGELGILPSAQDGGVVPVVRSLPLVDQGMIIDIMSGADNNTKVVGARTVNDIDVPGRIITISGANIAGSAAGDYFTVADSVATASGSLHTNGIRAWIDTANPVTQVGNLGAIDRTAAGNKIWQGTVLSNGGTLRPLTEDLIMQGMDTTRERGGAIVSDFMSNLPIIRRYHESLRADVFFALNAVEPLGKKVGIGRAAGDMQSGENSEGETPYQFSGVPWRAEMFFDANTLIGFNREHFFIGHGENEVPQPLSEVFDDMTPFFTSTANTTFEVVSYWQGELLCDNPPASFKVKDIAET